MCVRVCVYVSSPIVPAANGISKSTYKPNRQFMFKREILSCFFNSLNPCVIILKGEIMVLGGCHLIKNMLNWPKFLIALDLAGLYLRSPPP